MISLLALPDVRALAFVRCDPVVTRKSLGVAGRRGFGRVDRYFFRQSIVEWQGGLAVMTLVSFAPYPAQSMPQMLPFTPTRAEGLRRLNAFVAHAGRDYPLNRNY